MSRALLGVTVILLDLPEGALRSAVFHALRANGQAVRFATGPDDLFADALDCQAIVHASPAAAGARAAHRADHGHALLGAMQAPGQRRLVALLSRDAVDDALAKAIRRSGAPYAVLRLPPLLETVGRRLFQDAHRHHWVPGSAAERVVGARDAADRVVQALASAEDGIVEEVFGETLTWAQIAARLGADAPRPRVHTLPDPLFRAGQKLGLFRAPLLTSSGA